MKRSLIIALLALAVVAAACGDDSDDSAAATSTSSISSEAPTTTTTATPEVESTTTTTQDQSTETATVVVSGSGLGEIVTDGEGNSLYLFVPDEQGDSVCYDECAAAWPPLVGEVAVGDGVDAALLGVTVRTDGAEQVTYNEWPLYYFAADQAAGDTRGQGVNEVWYVLGAAGDAVR